MKKTRFLFLLAILVIITILRETGLVNLSLYNSSINTSSTSRWSNDNISYGNSYDSASTDCIPTDISQISIRIWGKDGLFMRDSSACDELHFDIKNRYHGLFWLPLYKNFSFTASITCRDFITMNYENIGKGYVGYRISGIVTVHGQVNVIGFCSFYTLKRIINNDLLKTVQEIGRTQLEKL